MPKPKKKEIKKKQSKSKAKVDKLDDRRCLKCNKFFTPTDQVRNFLCPSCNKENTNVRVPRIVDTSHLGGVEGDNIE